MAEGRSTGPPSSLKMGQMEEKVREQIRVLQERRAAAMINEITDLQRERDLALAKSRLVQKTVDKLQEENTLLRSQLQSENILQQEIKSLERAYLEEKLFSKDLKKKLQQKTELVAMLQTSSPSPLVEHRTGELITQNARSVSLCNLSVQR